jgi:hypothetical protein
MKFRIGQRESFIEKSHGLLFSKNEWGAHRKNRSTRIQYISLSVLPLVCGIGSLAAIADLIVETPLTTTLPLLPESNLGKILSLGVMGTLTTIGYYNLSGMADNWWVIENKDYKKPKPAVNT